MQSLLHDLRYGLRTLAQNPGFTLVATLTLALGIGANTAIFSMVNAFLLRPMPFPEAERLVFLSQTHAERNLSGSVAFADYLDWRAQNQVFEDLAAITRSDVNLTGVDEPERLRTYRATASIFSTLGVKPVLGRAFLPQEDRPGGGRVVVIGYGLWQRRFAGRTDALGRTVLLDGLPHTIVGVTPAGFRLHAADCEALTPLALGPADGRRGAQFLQVVARIKPGVTLERVQAGMSTIADRLAKQYPENAGWGVTAENFRERYVRNARQGLTVLLTAVYFVLLIVCANVANLLLARAMDRRREMTIRYALGASRGRIVRQMLTESALLSMFGGLLGVALGFGGVRLIAATLPPQMLPLSGEIGVDGTVLGYAALVSLLTAAVFGLAPAIVASRTHLSAAMSDGQRGGHASSRPRLRGALVVAEIALAVVLMVGVGLLLQAFLRLMKVDPGFQPENALTMEISLPEKVYSTPAQRSGFFDRAVERATALPGVSSAAAASQLPMTGDNSNWNIAIEGQPEVRPGETIYAGFRIVTPDYFRTLGIRLLKGRPLTAQDREGAPSVAVVNQSMVKRFWPNEDPIGKRFRLGGLNSQRPWTTVAGVAANTADFGLSASEWPILFLPSAQQPAASMTLVVRTAMDPAGLAKPVREAVRAVDPNQPVGRVRTLQQIVSDSVMVPRVMVRTLGVFAALALMLAGVGLYGVVAYSVSQRTHELGVRIALGAAPGRVVGMVLRQGMSLAAIGLAIGAAGGLAVARLLSSLQEGVEPHDPLTLASVAATLGAVALAACLAPARRATRVDPIAALRQL